MNTVRDNIESLANNVTALLSELLNKHSSIYRWNVADPNAAVAWIGPDYAWKPLSVEGRKVQSQLLQEYHTFITLVNSLLQNQAQDSLRQLNEHNETIIKIIEQNQMPWEESITEVLEKGIASIQGIAALVDRLYSAAAEPLFIPDTNALIKNPGLESWNFSGINVFTLVLTPSVLRELDELKVNHRNEDVRSKAQQVINRVKEYRRRGNLSVGVPVVSGKITLKTIAAEPNLNNSLPWFDSNNQDDRFLASTIEIMRTNTSSPVTIVTGDINLQNKADFARIPYCEPPDP